MGFYQWSDGRKFKDRVMVITVIHTIICSIIVSIIITKTVVIAIIMCMCIIRHGTLPVERWQEVQGPNIIIGRSQTKNSRMVHPFMAAIPVPLSMSYLPGSQSGQNMFTPENVKVPNIIISIVFVRPKK